MTYVEVLEKPDNTAILIQANINHFYCVLSFHFYKLGASLNLVLTFAWAIQPVVRTSSKVSIKVHFIW